MRLPRAEKQGKRIIPIYRIIGGSKKPARLLAKFEVPAFEGTTDFRENLGTSEKIPSPSMG